MHATGRMDSGGRQYADQVPYSGGMTWSTAPPQQQSYAQPPVYYGQSSHGYQPPPPQQANTYAYQGAPPPQHQHQPPPHPHHHGPPPPVSQHQPHPQHQYAASPPADHQPDASENYETSVYVGLDDAPSEFRLAFRVIGEKGQNLEYLSRTTGAKVILRGRGTGILNNKPLHIYVGHSTLEGKEEAESLSNNLVRAVKEEYADWRKTKGLPAEKPVPASIARTTNGARPQGRPSPQSELRELTITRDQVGRVKVRQEDRRVVQIQRPDQSALSRLGPRVDERSTGVQNREQQVHSHPLPPARSRQAIEGERRRELAPRQRSRSPIDRAPVPLDRAPVPLDRAPVPLDRAPVPLDRAPVPLDRAPVPLDRAPGRGSRGSPPSKQVLAGERGDLYVKVNQGTRREEPEDRGVRKQDSDERGRDMMMREERRPKAGLTITANNKNRDIKTQDWKKSSDERSGREREAEKSEKRREWSPEKSRYSQKERREPSPERKSDSYSRRPPPGMRHPPPRRRASRSPSPTSFGLAGKNVRSERFNLTVWGQPRKHPSTFFVPGMHQGELEKALEKGEFERLNPIFVVRKAPVPPTNHIWVLGDTACYMASQRAAEHPEGPNLGIHKTMILWFGFPRLKIIDVASIVKGKLGKNMDPTAVILHVGGEDLVNYVGRLSSLERDMENMVHHVKKLLPRTHLSWSNILPWKHYPSKVKPAVLEELRNKTNDIAKQLMKKCKGSSLYHDHDFRPRKDGKQVYVKGGFYPSPEGGKCMVLNFMSIIKDLVSRPVRD